MLLLHLSSSEWWLGTELAVFPRRCSANMPDFIGDSNITWFIRSYLF